MTGIRIIPRLDIKGPNVVKGIHSEGLRIVGSPVELAKKYYADGADEIIYMDIVASLYQRNLDFDLLRAVSADIFVPLIVGGGLRSIHDINNALRAGADKIAINTYAVRRPEFLAEAVHKFGSQCIVLSVEAKKIGQGQWEAYTDGGREHSGREVIAWIKQAIECGVGEVLVTSIDQDGTRRGYDLALVQAVSAFSTVPVIAHGGAGDMAKIKEVIEIGKADAVSASSVFHYNDFSITGLKQRLSGQGLNIRLP